MSDNNYDPNDPQDGDDNFQEEDQDHQGQDYQFEEGQGDQENYQNQADGQFNDQYQQDENDQFNFEQQQPEDEEEDDDFPEYANEQNKQLNEIIKEKRKLIKNISRKIEEKQDRSKVLKEHLKNVQTELLHTQALIDQKNKEIETEDHLKQITERQIGRIESEFRKLEKLSIEQQEKLNDVQNQIFKGNEKMDQYKLQMNWNQEELEQWALAARQKEEDNLTLEKYKRSDEVKIKELNLQIERLTSEVGKKQNELEKEITETQASQIELDKTAEEFKQQHQERHKLFQQWQEVTETISKRDGSIRDEGENFAKIKLDINQNKDALEERKTFLKQGINDNKELSNQISRLERENIDQISENKKVEEILRNRRADVEILKNQVSAFASRLQQSKNRISILSQDLLTKKQRLNNAQKKYNSHQIQLKNEALTAKQYEENKQLAEKRYKTNEKELHELELKIRKKKDKLFKHTQELFKFREKEANLYGEIQGNMAACRNLQSHINKLNQEFQRQQELLYNAEYQIQLMERRVNKAKGERTLEEKKDLDIDIAKAKVENANVKQEHKDLSESLKKLDDELRQTDKKSNSVTSEKTKFKQLIDSLNLENDMTYQDLSKIVKKKEEVLVQHDVMKLEIKKIQENLNNANQKVFSMENKQYQLELSMQEREKEIQVHKDVLVTEHKAAEEERHKIAVELAERKNRVKNLKIKYESLVQKNKASNGEVESVHEHSQAYYVIKAAQEREELQRKGDELNAKILKSEKELKAMDNTLNHLKNRNSKYRDSFLNKGVTQQEVQAKDALSEQCNAASENLFKAKNELQEIQRKFEEDLRRSNEHEQKIRFLKDNYQQIIAENNSLQSEIDDQGGKLDRALTTLQASDKLLKEKKPNVTENNIHILAMYLDRANLLTKTCMSALYNLTQDNPELDQVIREVFGDQVQLPSRAPSTIDVQSNYSNQSRRSVGSQGSRGSQLSGRR